MKSAWNVLCLTLLLSQIFVVHAQARDFLLVNPVAKGVSKERLQRINSLVDGYVENNQYSGVVTLIARDGKIVHEYAAGTFGVDDDTPLQTDSLFRIYSMTKPITAAAAMILYERGKFHLDDPVSKYLPEFADQKILVEDKLREPASPMTIRQLFTHTAGLTYGWTKDNPVDIQYSEADLFASKNLTEFTEKLAALPLRFEPGTRYHYSVSYDVLGALIERLSGMPLDQFFETEIFTPLGMQDTFFAVPENKLHRLAADQGWDYQQNKIITIPAAQQRSFTQVDLLVGGGGLVSTARDYLRFCQMILNGGELNRVRILGPKTVAMMSGDHLTDKVRSTGVGQYPSLDLYKGQSMALGYGVVIDPVAMPDISSAGELSWGGVAGTKFWIDSQEKLIGIALVQLYQSPWPLRSDLKTATYQALDELY